MGIGTWIFAGVAVGGTVLYFRAQRSAPSEKDLCDRLAELNPDAGKACKLAKGLLDAVQTDSRADKERHNNELNGEVDLRAHASMPIVKSGTPHANVGRGGASQDFTLLGDQGYAISPDARVLRYKNGCVPYKSAAGWSDCVEGTKDISPLTRKPHVLSGDPWDDKDEWGTHDPTTLQHKASAGPFPLPVPAGSSGWWHMGTPVVCPAGTGLVHGAGIRDHRPGASPCQQLDSRADDPIFPPPDPTRVCNAGETYTVRIDHRTSPATRKYTPCRPANTSGTITIGAHADEKD